MDGDGTGLVILKIDILMNGVYLWEKKSNMMIKIEK